MFNAAERLTADEALNHVYFADCQHLSDSDSTASQTSSTSVVCTPTHSHYQGIDRHQTPPRYDDDDDDEIACFTVH